MALILAKPLLWISAVVLAAFLFWLRLKLRLRWQPAWLLRLALVLLALLGFFYPESTPPQAGSAVSQVLVLDQSDSIPRVTRQQAAEQAARWQAAEPGRVVIAAGAEPRVVVAPAESWPELDGRMSNLQDALLLAKSLSAPGGSLILASDGLADDPAKVESAVRQAADDGLRLDVLPLAARADQGDVYTGPLQIPSALWEDTPLNLVVPVYSTGALDAGSLTFEVRINGAPVDIEPLPLGDGYFLFRLPGQEQGMLEAAVTVSSPGDPFTDNNASYATLMIYASPDTLFVSDQPDRDFTGMLEDYGLGVDSITPDKLTPEMMDVARYQVIWINNILSSHFSSQQMAALRGFVEDQGGGLVFLGGQNSYTLGGYDNTVIEPILPVRLEAPERSQKPPVVFLLVLDKSDSMGVAYVGEQASIDLAKEAAIRAIEMLDSRDMLGVLVYSSDPYWRMSTRSLGDGIALRDAMDAVSSIEESGGTYMYEALQMAVESIGEGEQAQIPQRFILLLTDGYSADGSPEEYSAVARLAQQKGATISTIALGEEADGELLELIAKEGGGRFYAVENASDLPRVMMNETRAARSDNIQTGLTALQPGEANHPVLSGFTPERLPQVEGYNALRSRSDEGAEDILLSASFSDPLLSAWQVGLGRVVAWTSDLGQLWRQPWPEARDEGYFWSQVVRYALSNPAVQAAAVSVASDGSHTTVRADLQGSSGQALNLLPVSFLYTSPGGQVYQAALQQVEPGGYTLQMDRLPVGTYRAVLRYPGGGGAETEVLTPFAVNPPDEWLPATAAEREAGLANLRAWAALAGGNELQALEASFAISSASAKDMAFAKDMASAEDTAGAQPVLFYLLLALVLAWPLEIAIRRRWLPWTSQS